MTAAKAAGLPANALGAWMAAKVSTVYQIPMSSDQIGVLRVLVQIINHKTAARNDL